MTASRRAALPLGALVAATLLWGGLYIHRTSFVHAGERVFSLWDDAMISMQYARNLRLGEGLVWNAGGERVQGFTNPGVTLVMSALHLLPLPDERTSLAVQLLALGLLGASLVGVHRLARRSLPDSAERKWLALGAALATACCAPFTIWTLQGSDVGFVAVWLVVAVLWLSAPPRRAGAFACWLGLGAWIRLDVALLSALLAAAWARAPGGGARRGALGLAAVAGAVAIHAAASQLYYGDPLPNTFYLKATGSPRQLVLLSGLNRLAVWLLWLALPAAMAWVGLRAAPRRSVARVCVALFVAALAYNTWVGGDFLVGWGSRFVAPTLPLLLVPATAGVWRVLARMLPPRTLSAPAGRALFLAAAAFTGWITSPFHSGLEWLGPTAPTMLRDANRSNYRFAAYLREHTDPSTTLAAHWGGVPPYFSRRPAIDVLGKSDPHIARLEVPRFFAGHSKWDWDYVLRRRPDVFRAPSRGLGDRRDFRRDYVRVETRGGLRFYMRRDALPKLFDREVRIVAPGAPRSPQSR